jgi:uncharacterized membrane protein
MAEENKNSRLETFCDGVFAIALTLLVIDIKIPPSVTINNTADFWYAILHIVPSILAFLLSFVIILIAWVNHHAALKLVDKTSASFLYANGFLMLTIVIMPFPTSLMGEYILTDHAAPAVILYNSALVLQSIGWILLAWTALKNKLGKNDKSNLITRQNQKFGYFAFSLYSICAILAFWFPLVIAIITTLSWIIWLIWGIKLKHE